ncbi:unnamed protein product [Cochlearia groenlandica]
MAGFSSLNPRTNLRRAVIRATGNLTAPLGPISKARSLFTGGGSNGVYGERGLLPLFNVIRNHKAFGYDGSLTSPYHHLLDINGADNLSYLRVRSMSFQIVKDSRVSPRRVVNAEVEQAVADSSNKVNAENPRKHQTGENIPKKDKIKFLVNTLLDIEDNKEAVYGALDAWVAWERNFPIASLKKVITILEKEHQWHRMVQVIKWLLSKGQGNTMGTYGQLIRALDMDRRAKEAHAIWRKKIGNDLHSVPWQLCLQMILIYFRNNMLQELVKLFKDLESYDRKPSDKYIVQSVADAYELLGMLEEKERVLTKYSNLFLGVKNPEALTEDAVVAAKENLDNSQVSEAVTEK